MNELYDSDIFFQTFSVNKLLELLCDGDKHSFDITII